MKSDKKLLIFGVFPGPITGQSIANLTTYQLLKDVYDTSHLNLAFSDKVRPIKFNFWNFIAYAFRTNWAYAKNLFKLRKLLREFDAKDVVFFNLSPTIGGKIKEFFFILLMRSNQAKLIGISHNAQFVKKEKICWLTPLNKHLRNRLDIAIFNSYMFYNQSLLPEHKKVVCYNTIRSQVLLDKELVYQHIDNIKEKKIEILYLSNFIRTKGIIEFLDALLILKKKGLDFHANVIGAFDDIETQKLIKYKVKQLKDNATLLAPIYDEKRIKKIYLDAHIFVLPTYYPNEMQPLSILEAKNAGCVIISTNQATIPEMVDDGKSGFLVEKRNALAIAQAIEVLESDRNKWSMMAQTARHIFDHRFSQSAMKQKFIEIIGTFN